jgi:hypothetical protein
MVEYPSLQLSPQGEALIAFAQAHGHGEVAAGEPPGGAGGSLASLRPLLYSTGSAPIEGSATTMAPPAASPALLSRVTLSRAPARLRGRAVWVALGCAGDDPCAGRLTLVLELTRRRDGKRVERGLEIGHTSFALGPHAALRVRVPISSEGRRLLAGGPAERQIDAVLNVAQSSPQGYPVVRRRVRLVASRSSPAT